MFFQNNSNLTLFVQKSGDGDCYTILALELSITTQIILNQIIIACHTAEIKT
jgi:hypothetical protein